MGSRLRVTRMSSSSQASGARDCADAEEQPQPFRIEPHFDLLSDKIRLVPYASAYTAS
jgi:hypothetical protein